MTCELPWVLNSFTLSRHQLQENTTSPANKNESFMKQSLVRFENGAQKVWPENHLNNDKLATASSHQGISDDRVWQRRRKWHNERPSKQTSNTHRSRVSVRCSVRYKHSKERQHTLQINKSHPFGATEASAVQWDATLGYSVRTLRLHVVLCA